MPNAFRDYAATGEPDTSRARGAAVADLAIGALIGILVWPFPVMRIVFRSLAGSEGAGWAIHVPALLAFMVLASWLCVALAVRLGRRTVGMYFADLGFPGPLGVGGALAAARPWTLAGLAGTFGGRGPAERFARERLMSTRAPA